MIKDLVCAYLEDVVLADDGVYPLGPGVDEAQPLRLQCGIAAVEGAETVRLAPVGVALLPHHWTRKKDHNNKICV